MQRSPERLLTSCQVRELMGGISDMSLWRWLNSPDMAFPKPIYIARRRYWREVEIVEWQAEKFAAQQPTV